MFGLNIFRKMVSGILDWLEEHSTAKIDELGDDMGGGKRGGSVESGCVERSGFRVISKSARAHAHLD